MQLNSTSAESGAGSVFGSTFTGPTSSVFSVGNTGETGTADKEYIAYCWHSVTGKRKFGSFTGNGSNSHSITGLGFQPDFVMIKGITSGGAGGWYVFDSVRGAQNYLRFNTTGSASTSASSTLTSFDSDGFTLGSDGYLNGSSKIYIYWAEKIH